MNSATTPHKQSLFARPLFAPGSLAWLSAHHTRLTMRRRMGDMNAARMGVMGVLLVILLGIILAASHRVAMMLLDPATTPLLAQVTGGALGAFIAMLLFSSGLINTAQSIGERSDLDLLLSAPVPPERTAAARLLGATAAASVFPMIVAASTLLMPAILVSPMFALSAVSVVGIALICASLGQMIVVPVHAWLGAPKARLVAQILGIGVTAGPVIAFNLAAARDHSGSMFNSLRTSVEHGLGQWPILGVFADAMIGKPLQAFGLLAFGIGLFALTTRVFGASFARSAATAGPAKRTARITKPIRFSSSGLLRSAFIKELRSIGRDPWLITQLGMQGFALIPIVIVVQGMGGLGAIDATVLVGVVAMMVLFSGQIAASLAWVTASTEQAQDLLDAAPVSRSGMVVAKGFAAFVCSLVVVGALSLWALLTSGLRVGSIIACAATLNTICVILIELWRPKPARRERMMRAGDRSILSIGYAMMTGLSWGVAGGAALLSGWSAAAVAAFLGTLLTAIAWWTSPVRKASD